jgi:stringent starvation protein B
MVDEMTSSRPYFIRALYDWLVDNGLTPHLLVNAEVEGVSVPVQYVENGQVVLNISPSATQALEIGNDIIRFSARFGGMPMDVRVPPNAVLGIYARENGRGMLFPEQGEDGLDPNDDGPGSEPSSNSSGKRPNLKVVK